MTLEDCRRRLAQLQELRAIVSFGPDKARLGEQEEALRRECERLEGEKADRDGA